MTAQCGSIVTRVKQNNDNMGVCAVLVPFFWPYGRDVASISHNKLTVALITFG